MDQATHDIMAGGKYFMSVWNPTDAQLLGAMWYAADESGHEDVKAVLIADGSVVADIANHEDDTGADYNFQGGDRHPDPTDSMTFDDGDDAGDIEPEMDFDGDLVDHFYNLFGDRHAKPLTPADFR